MTRKSYLAALLVAVVGLSVVPGAATSAGVAGTLQGNDAPGATATATVSAADGGTTPDANETADVTFGNASANGSAVVVERVVLPAGGYVVVRNESGAVVGASNAFIEPGTHEDVAVPLTAPVAENETLVAVLHRETDDDLRQIFEYFRSNGTVDYPYTADGEVVSDSAPVTQVANATGPTAGTETPAGTEDGPDGPGYRLGVQTRT